MEKYSRIVGGGTLFYFLLLNSVSNAQVTITTQPTNDTVCLTEDTTATFTCVVDRRGIDISSAGWHVLVGGTFVSTFGRDRHMSDPSVTGDTVTDILTVSNVSVNDNGALYRCEPHGNVISNNATLTVLDPPAITTVEVTGICTNDFTLSWTTASNEEGLHYTVSIVSDNISIDLMDTSYNVTGLTPGTTYTVGVFTRLRTALLAPCLGFSTVIINTTLTVAAGVPQGVQLESSTTTTAIIIEWDPPDSPSDCGPVFYYIVTVDGSNAKNIFKERAEFFDLINGTNYTISVAAVNRAGTGPASSIIVEGNVEAPNGGGTTNASDSSSSGPSGGAIAGIIIGVLVVILIIIVIIGGLLYWRYKKNNDNKEVPLNPSTSPDSPPPADSAKSIGSAKPVHSAKPTAKKAKKDKTKAASKKPETQQKAASDGVEYADLQHGSSGTSRPPPTVDHTKKVAYVEVKEHPPLDYAQVQHEPGSENKPIQGATHVEYKEVWHQ